MLKVFVFVCTEGYRESRRKAELKGMWLPAVRASAAQKQEGAEGKAGGSGAPSCAQGTRRHVCTADEWWQKGAHLRTAQVHKEQCVYTPVQGKAEQKHPRVTAQLGHSCKECLTKECSFYKIEDLGGGGKGLRDRLILNVQQPLCELIPEGKLYRI